MTSVLYNRHKETIHNFSWRSLQLFGKYGVTAVIFFVAARLLSPEDFGLLNYLRTVFFLLMIFCDFGLSIAVSKFVVEYKIDQPEKLNRIAFTIVIFSVGIGALISVAVIFLGNTFFKENYRYILCFLPYLFLIPLTDILDGMYRGLKEFKKLAVISSIASLVSIGLSIFLINRYLLLGVIWSLNITSLLLFLSLCGFQKNFRFEFDKSVLIEVLKYAVLLGIGTVAGFLYTRVSILILKQYGFLVEVGYFSLIDSVFQLLFLPFGILGQVIAPNTTAYITVRNIAEIKSKVKKYAAFCVVAGLALSVSLYFGIPFVVKIIFPRYNTADFFLIMNILLLLMPFYVWGAVLNQGFIIPAGMARIYVVMLLIGGILNVILNYVFISLFGFVGVFWVIVGLHSVSTVVITVYFYIRMNAFAKNPSCLQKINLDGGGERVDIFYGENIVFDCLDMYQKNHYRRYEFAKSVISPGKVIGDFACGTGYGTIMLSKNAGHVIGADINKDVVEQITRRYADVKNTEFVCSNLLNLTYESRFDYIVSFETVEHLEEADIPKLFAVFARALKPDGVLIFSTPYQQAKSPEAVNMGFHQTFDIDEVKIESWLSKNGLVPECFKYQNYKTHDIKGQLSQKDFVICVARTRKDKSVKKHMRKVSILIPTFNRANYLKMAVDSAIAQTYPDTEILVLDDCSTDNTASLSETYRNTANVTFIRNETNIGFINSWNKAVALSSGEYIKIMGDDDILSANCVAEQACILDEHPDVGVVCCNYSIIDESNRVKNNNNSYKLFSLDTKENGLEFIKNYLLGRRTVGWPGAILFRRQDINKAGGFDPQAGCPADIDMWCRILQVKDFYYLDKMLAYCRLFSGNLSRKLDTNDFGYKEFLYFYSRTVPCVEHILDEPAKRRVWSALITRILPFYSKAQARNKAAIKLDIDEIAREHRVAMVWVRCMIYDCYGILKKVWQGLR